MDKIFYELPIIIIIIINSYNAKFIVKLFCKMKLKQV